MIERTKIKLSLLFLEYLKEILKPDSRTLRKYIRNNRENIDVTYGDFIDLTDIKILYTISDYIAQNQNIFNFKLVITEDLVNLNLTNLLANHNVDDANYVDIGFLSASKIDLIC
jgi:hypothetical protein